VTEAADEGSDLVLTAVSYALPDSVEWLYLRGLRAIDGTGNELDNIIHGNAAANRLDGGLGDDNLYGMSGDDLLVGGLGNDRLSGGAGADGFLFDTGLDGSANVDRVVDFSVADDHIQLHQSVFTALALGTLSADAFASGTEAQDADDRIVYDSATGRIYYDADGNGAGAQMLFATVTAGTALTSADFQIVG
jgi:Ca2+-binding RTX toxin-like protein